MINNSKHQIISSNIAPNPIEVKFWLDTNSNLLKTYKDGKWEAMTGGGNSSDEKSNVLDLTEVFDAFMNAEDMSQPLVISKEINDKLCNSFAKYNLVKQYVEPDTMFYNCVWSKYCTRDHEVIYLTMYADPTNLANVVKMTIYTIPVGDNGEYQIGVSTSQA